MAASQNFAPYCKYIRYLHDPNVIVFTILSAIKQARFHLSRLVIGGITLILYVSYFSSLQCNSNVDLLKYK